MTDRRRFYDGIAEEFDDLMNSYDLERRLEVMFDDLLGTSDLAGALVLDAGCGTGAFSLAAQARGARVVAMDIGPRLLVRTRAKGVGTVVAADVAALPFATGTFDVVISSECIEHTPSPSASVGELTRVLRPAGRLALTCPNRTWYWSCAIADRLGIRKYKGLENWPRWSELRAWTAAGNITDVRHRGLHLFPFMLAITHPMLRALDRFGGIAGPLFVNQCISGTKRSRSRDVAAAPQSESASPPVAL